MDIEGYPFRMEANGYFHTELQEEIIYADEAEKIDDEIARFRRILQGRTASTRYLHQNLFLQSTFTPLSLVAST